MLGHFLIVVTLSHKMINCPNFIFLPMDWVACKNLPRFAFNVDFNGWKLMAAPWVFHSYSDDNTMTSAMLNRMF